MSGLEREAMNLRRGGDGGIAMPARIPEGEDDPEAVSDPDRAHRYMSVAARLNFVALNQPWIIYSVKELMRQMSNPAVGDGMKLKRVLRYMAGNPPGKPSRTSWLFNATRILQDA